MVDELSPEIGMDALRAIRDALRDRERRIVSEVLQVPDYPPLPPCPRCGAEAETVGSDEDTTWFKPCGHRFRISLETKLALRP
ncbi:hypothetical protein [Streptomyces sp. NPDC005407]|uniref:hypothetical protein n=1 Tax=Streptomyces sp. NPDC005407 TaxID=3155340 RepID=UPI0033B94CEE